MFALCVLFVVRRLRVVVFCSFFCFVLFCVAWSLVLVVLIVVCCCLMFGDFVVACVDAV